jgi:hypothetical protein
VFLTKGNQMRNDIIKLLVSQYPDIAQGSIEKAVDKYISVMKLHIAESIFKFGYENNSQISLPMTSIRKQIGRMTVNGKQIWITDLMKRDPRTSIIQIDKRGYEGKVSLVSINPYYEKELMNEVFNVNAELNPNKLKEIRINANYDIVVDPLALQEYISKTTNTYNSVLDNKNTSEAYKNKLVNNLLIAKQLLSQIESHNDVYFIREYWKQSDSGRVYGQGLSLQRVPKEVRNAALGVCHQYDFQASSFALMAGLAHQIDPSLKIETIKEYIKDRAVIRKRIAKALSISEDWTKDIFTSLGFGASTANNPFTSIRGKLGAEKYTLLMNNQEFRHIKEAIEQVRAIIADYFVSDNFEFMGMTYSNIDPNSDPLRPKKRTINQKLAWIYQVMESTAIQEFTALVADNQYPLLFAHDCVYFKNKIHTDKFATAMNELRKTFPLLKIEHQEIIPIYNSSNPKIKQYERAMEEELAHKKLIAQKKLEANNGFVPNSGEQLDLHQGYFSDYIKELNPTFGLDLGTSFAST